MVYDDEAPYREAEPKSVRAHRHGRPHYYTYDGMGRTVTKAAPDGSTTTYSYSGNTVTVTDPAGKNKMFTMDAFGNKDFAGR